MATEHIFVGPHRVPCEGSYPQECLQVRRSLTSEWELFYDEIEGFVHVPGTTYELVVAVDQIADPPADASSLRYRLVEVVAATTA